MFDISTIIHIGQPTPYANPVGNAISIALHPQSQPNSVGLTASKNLIRQAGELVFVLAFCQMAR